MLRFLSNLPLHSDEPLTIESLPLHPLVVHAVVVLVPLAALGTILMVIWPRFSRRFGVLVILVGVVAAASAWLARVTGEQLDETHEAGQVHMELGFQMPWWASAFSLGSLAFWALDRRLAPSARRPLGLKVVALIALTLAFAALYFIFLTGDSGARAVWGANG